MKYIEIRHIDFWFDYYNLNKNSDPKPVEVNIYDDETLSKFCIQLDISTKKHLERELADEYKDLEYFLNSINQYDSFMKYYARFASGEIYYIIYNIFLDSEQTSLKELNSILTNGKKVAEIKRNYVRPFCANVYVNESDIFTPSKLIHCIKRLFVELNLGENDFEIVNPISLNETKYMHDKISLLWS